MSDPKSKTDDKATILPLGQPAVSTEFAEFRNLVLTTTSTEECQRELAEMSHDLSSFSFDEEDQPVNFNGSLLPAVSPDALPSSQILAEGNVEAPDGDFAGFETLEFDENSILAQIEERVVDLEAGPSQLSDDDVEADLVIPVLGTDLENDNADEADDISGFNDLNLGEFSLDAAGLEDLDFQTDFAEPAVAAEASVDSPIEAPIVEDLPVQGEAGAAEPEPEAIDTSLLGLDFGDEPVAAVQPEVPGAAAEPFQAEALETQDDTEDFVLPDMDFEAPSEPVALEAVSEEEGVDAFDPAAFDLPDQDDEIATEAFTPDFGAPEHEAPVALEVDAPIDGAMFDAPATYDGDDEDEALDLGIPDFEVQDQQNDDTFAISDTFAAAEDEFIVPNDDEAVDMVAVISAEREVVDDTPPVYDALDGERVLPVEEATSVEAFAEPVPEEIVSPIAADESEPAAPIFAENAKKSTKRGWILPLAASVAALALAAGGGYYYYSIGTPGLEQYLGGQRPITVAVTEPMPGTDVSQGVLPQTFEPVTEQVPLDPGQGSIVPDMSLGESDPLPAAGPIEATPEIAALFAELDAAAGPELVPAVAEPLGEPASAESDASAALDAMPEIEEFDIGLEEPVVTPNSAGEELGETDAELDQPAAPANAPNADPDMASIIEVQEMFAQQIITLQADIEDLKTASFTAPGQANVMGEMMLEVTRLAEQMAVVNARLMGVEGRVASAPTVTLPGANTADAETLRRLEQQMELLSNNVGIIARMAAGSSNSAVPGFNAVSDAPAPPIPAPRPPAEAPRVSDSPNQAAGFTISSKPTNASALGRVAKGDFVEGYGYVLEVMPISGGGKLVQMENGTVLVE